MSTSIAIKFVCPHCNKGFIEHRIPVARGGTNDLGNLCVACADCNLRKGTMTADEFEAQEAWS